MELTTCKASITRKSLNTGTNEVTRELLDRSVTLPVKQVVFEILHARLMEDVQDGSQTGGSILPV